VVLGALLAAGDRGVVSGIHLLGEERRGLLGEVAAVAGDPFVVGVDEDRADESDDGRGVGEDPDDSAAALDLLVDPFDYPALAVGASVSVVLIIAGGRC
jgi:hypothetical protein